MVSNRGELARGWYERVVKIQRDGPDVEEPENTREPLPKRQRKDNSHSEEDEEEEDEFGPAPPGQERKSRHGPGAPKLEELQMQKGTAHPYIP